MDPETSLCGMYALTALRLCQMGCIGPHLPFEATTARDTIYQNQAILDIGDEESRFLAVLANYIQQGHPHSQSIWVICEAAGEFMRELDDRKMLEHVYELITQVHNTDEEKTEEKVAEAENMAEDENVAKEENERTDGREMDEENRRDKKQELVDTIIVCRRKFRSREY
jgi:hypothetical protein